MQDEYDFTNAVRGLTPLDHATLGPCAKRRVVAVATVRGPLGMRYFIGENLCTNPQSTCPRSPGEGYAKCYSVCGQLGHAEENLLRQIRMAGVALGDIQVIHVYGQPGPCDHCRALLRDLGLLAITKFYGDAYPKALSFTDKHRIKLAYNLNAPSSHSRSYRVDDVLSSQSLGPVKPDAKGSEP